MADKTIPQLDPVVTPAPTDRFGVRQAGDIEDKRETRAQVHALEDGEFLLDSFTNGITANPIGTQAAGTVLTSAINFIQTCNDAGDSVTLPSTFPVGFIIEVHIRDTDDSCDVFPALGDDLGEGLNTARRLQPNEQVRFIATVADTTWVRLFQELIQAESIAGGIIRADSNAAASSPSLIPSKQDLTTGIGAGGVGILSLVTAGRNVVNFSNPGGIEVVQQWSIDETVTAFAGGGQGSATVLLSTWNLINVVATTGDSVALPATFQPGTLIWLKNTGAETLDVFPASGDDLGQGVDTAVSVVAGDSTQFIGAAANSIWEQESPVVMPASLDNLLLSQTPGAHEASPTLRFGDGDTGYFEDADDSLSKSIGGTVQSVTGVDGKLFINTLTGAVSFQGGNIITPTPDKISIFGARTATNGVDGGAVEIWGGYAAGVSGFPEGGRVGIWGGGGGGGEAMGGNIEMFGGEADALPGDIILTGGVATVSGTGGQVQIIGGVGFGASSQGGFATVTGGAATGTSQGGDVRVIAGASGPGATGVGGTARLTAGASLATNGAGGQVVITAGLGAGSGAGGALSITGGKAGSGGAGTGGAVDIKAGEAGAGGSGAGGVFTASGGDAVSTGPGGAANLDGGLGRFNDDGGAANVTGGDSGANDGGAGGAVTLTGGAALGTNGDGGDINLTAGAGAGSGVAGDINFTGDILGQDAAGPAIRDTATGEGSASIVPNKTDIDTGLGWVSADILSILAGGSEAISYAEANAGILASPKRQNLTAFAGGGQGSATQVEDSYITIGTVATTGDSIVLPAVFRGGTLMFIKNNGANAADVFPASGDDLGQGTDTAVSVAAGESVSFLGQTENLLWTPWIVPATGVASALLAITADGPQIADQSATATVPTLIPDRSDPNTGVGGLSDRLDLIAGGIQGLRVDEGDEATGAILIAYPQQDSAITAFATGGQASATQLESSISIITTCATAGDSVKLMRPSVLGAWVYVRNDGAASCDVFPFSGDDLGQGTDVAVACAPGQTRSFISTTVSGNIWVEIVGDVADSLFATNTSGPSILDEAASATNPTLVPLQSDPDSGMGSSAADAPSVIAGGVEAMRYTELNSNVVQAPDAQIGLTAFATGGQGSATQVNASYAVFSTVATLADSGRLPPVFKVGSVIIIKNDGAADMDMFPSSGDDLGAGTDTAVSIVAGTAAKFIATVADATWTQIAPVVAV